MANTSTLRVSQEGPYRIKQRTIRALCPINARHKYQLLPFFYRCCNKTAAHDVLPSVAHLMSPEQYNTCVDLHADGIYRFALKNMRDQDLAKDIVQESFARLWARIDKVDGKKGKSYLFTTAHHLMADEAKKRKRSTPMEEVHENQHHTSQAQPDLKEVLDRALATLPDIQRSVILLRDLEGYSYDEIAELTKLTMSQVKVYIYRGRTSLKAYIGNMNIVV